MKKLKLFILALIIPISCLFTTGCTQDTMDGISIVVTNYPNEYITKKMYGKHSNIKSIYPDGVDIATYKLSKKQKNEYSKADLFVYNGLIEKERDLAIELLDINPNLRIIDTAYVLETDYSPEELWLNPSSLLMMAQNIRLGLEEYTNNTYLKKDIDEAYDKLKIELSELDAEYRIAVESTNTKTLVVASSTLKYLEKFGLKIICIDSDATEKTIYEAEQLIESEEISYIYTVGNETLSDNAKNILDEYDIKKITLHKLNILSDEERSNKENYITLMTNNLDYLKQELYQ